MAASTFVYVTYIRTTPDKLWAALTRPEFTRRYFFGVRFDTDWKAGSPWRMVHADDSVTDAGEVLESDPPKRLVLKWRHEKQPELKAEGYGRCVIELEPMGEAVKLSVLHTMDGEGSKLIEAVGGGWPRILSNLKSLLETGTVVLEKK
jgi:uncharacterized protein YndB with AHSA1/START domain